MSELRAEAIAAVSEHYKKLYGGDASLDELREAYAIPKGVLPDAARRDDLTAFYFWAAWACGTNRPGTEITYTNNWPPEPLIDNRPTAAILVWSVLSFIVLLAGIGALSWYYVVEKAQPERPARSRTGPLTGIRSHPVHESDLEIFLGGDGPHRHASRNGRGNGALRRGGVRVLRYPVGRSSAVRRNEDVAHSSWRSFGLLPPFLPRACFWRPLWSGESRSFSAWVLTRFSERCLLS